jgi:hypothetical protein
MEMVNGQSYAFAVLLYSPSTRDLREKVPQSGKDKSLKEMSIFKKWYTENILREDKQTGSTAIVLLPISMTKPWYRDTPGGVPEISEPFTAMYLTIMTGMSQIVLPGE